MKRINTKADLPESAAELPRETRRSTAPTLSEPLLTEQQAAEVLCIRPGTLACWRVTKRYPLPYVKIGRSVRYRRSDLEAFAASREQSTADLAQGDAA